MTAAAFVRERMMSFHSVCGRERGLRAQRRTNRADRQQRKTTYEEPSGNCGASHPSSKRAPRKHPFKNHALENPTRSGHSVFVHHEKRMTRATERIQGPESSHNRIINVRHAASDAMDVQCSNYGAGGSAAHNSAKASVYPMAARVSYWLANNATHSSAVVPSLSVK